MMINSMTMIEKDKKKRKKDPFDFIDDDEEEYDKKEDDDDYQPISSPVDDDFDDFISQKKHSTSDYLPRRETRSTKKFYKEEGFENLGNTCYMNSILFALSNSKNFKKNLENEKFKENLNEKFKIISILKKLIFDLKGNKNVELNDLKKIIEKKNPQFIGESQQDAHVSKRKRRKIFNIFELGIFIGSL